MLAGKEKGKHVELETRLMAVELLALLKRKFTYRELERLTGLSNGMLSRYVTGQRVPRKDHAEKIISNILSKLDIRMLILEKLKESKGYIDLQLILSDILLLKLVALKAKLVFGEAGVNKVLVPEAGGIPLAALVAAKLNADLVIARRRKENPFQYYYEVTLAETPFTSITFYVPQQLLCRGDRVLLVDDLVQSGQTLKALAEIAKKAGAKIVGALALIAVGTNWRRIGIDNVHVVLEIADPSKITSI